MEPLMTAPLAAIIVTYNSAEVLPGLLDTLQAGLAGIPDFEVIVIDNNSRDRSADIAEAHPLGIRVVRTGRNGGYAAGINAAAAILPAETDLLILNPDIRLLPGSIAKLRACTLDASVGIVVPQIRNEDGGIATSLRCEPSLGATWAQAILGPALAARFGVGEMIARRNVYAQRRSVDWATGAILLVTARARKLVGHWDESFFLYSEEVDFQRRVRAHGLTVAYEPEAQVVHIGGDYMQSPPLTALMTSNQIRYFARHHGPLSTMLFRGALAAFGMLRAWRSEADRAVLRVALSPLRPARHYMPVDP